MVSVDLRFLEESCKAFSRCLKHCQDLLRLEVFGNVEKQ